MKKNIVMLIFIFTASYSCYAQNRVITGQITDQGNGKPMTGVSVGVKDATTGTSTNAEGRFSISAPANGTLIFSSVGYGTKEVQVNNRSFISITLSEDNASLNEVVVIGYGTQKKVNVLGSITSVSGKEIAANPVSDISNALAGRLPGAIIQQRSGEPGGDQASILIRGSGTLGNNAPLVVIDGVPGRDLNAVSPNDVESISVLKDAAAAIYGARAANGVILVTTKHGKAGAPPTINYGYYHGWLSPVKLPEMVDAATYATMFREWQTSQNTPESNMVYSVEDIEKYKSGKYPWTHPNTDWYVESMKDYSITEHHNLSISGGTKDVSYYGSFGSHFADGIYKKSASSYKRYNLKANVNAKVNKYLSVAIDISGTQRNKLYPTLGHSEIFQVIQRSRPVSPAFFPNGLPGPGDVGGDENPVVVSGLDVGSDDIKDYSLNTILSASLKIPGISGLTLSGYYSFDKNFGVEKLFKKPYTLYSLDKSSYLNAGNDGSQDGSDFLIPNFPSGVTDPSLEDSYSDAESKLFNLKLNYDKDFGQHNIGVFVAMESSDYLSKGISAFRRHFISDQLPYLFAGGTVDQRNDEFVDIDSRLNYFGRVMYNFKETYLLQFSLRRDGSLRFAEESGRWGTFPSVLAGWRVSNENFWKKNIKFIDFFKLKASYGQMGNDQVAPFQYLTGYGFGTGYVFGSNLYSPALIQSGTPNPNITWEVANIFNLGFESNLLNNRLTFNADFFYQRRSNILVKRNASVPNYTGITLPDENIGVVDNKGFELEMGYNDTKGSFSYGINGNLAFAKNKIINYDEPSRKVPWQVLTGHPIGALLLYKSMGIFRDRPQVDKLPHVNGAQPGDIIIQDVDNNGKIDNDDRVIFDNNDNPQMTYGVSFNFSYKNWSLTALIQGVGTTMRKTLTELREGTGGNYYAWTAEGRWTPDNIDAKKPRTPEGRANPYWRSTYQTDFNFQKGGYGRLKNMQLSYSIPQQLLKKIMMDNAQFYISGNNILLLYNQNKVTDPETGADMRKYPIMKVYTLGVNITF